MVLGLLAFSTLLEYDYAKLTAFVSISVVTMLPADVRKMAIA